MTATKTLKSLAEKVRFSFEHGAKLDYNKQDAWQRDANGYRCTLRYQGRQYSFDFWQGTGIERDPDAAGCLECLLSDSTVSDDFDDFDDFCREFGYDTDSRKAEATHRACMKVAENIRRLLGDDFETFLYADR